MGGRVAASPGTRRFRLASPKTVLVVLGCLVLVLGAAFVPFARLSHQSLTGNGGGTPFWTFLPFGVVGFVLAWRRPRNRLGWILVGLAVAGAFSQDGSLYAIADYRRRQQLKWLLGGLAVSLAGLVTAIALGRATGFWDVAGHVALLATIFAVPVSMGVAILKYRLYDIDRIISRTLGYAIITGLLVGVYAGLVLLTTEVLEIHSTVAVAASTLAAAALFNPLRRRVQLRVDRWFNRARYDAGQTVAAFAARLKDTVDLDSVRADLTGVVHQALEPAHVSVWMWA